ncbi:MAG: NnrU family protein [Alphaproteobacteria bacterium]
MTLLIAGVLIWTLVHLFKRVMPEARTLVDTKFGAGPAKGIISLIFLASILMMVIGFMAAGEQAVYEPSSWGAMVNNVLMIAAVFLMGAGSGKGIAPTLFRHPMLTGVIVWAGGHLLANGDMRSIVLFGGLGIWAALNMVVINMREGAWDRPVAGPLKADIKTVVISLVIFAVIAAIHHFIGPSPFGG